MTHALPNRWLLLFTVTTGLLLIVIDNTVLYTALPILTQELGATASQSLWIINAYPLVMAGLLLGSGTLGDRIGHRRMFLIGLALFGIASLIAAFSPTPAILIAARAFLAVGAAAMMPATLALIRIAFIDERERNLAIAIWGSLAIIGAAIGPIVGGLLLNYFWWGSVFLINVPVVILAFIATLFFAPKSTPDHSRSWDIVSSFQVLVALSALVFTIKGFAYVGQTWWVPFLALFITVVTGTIFVRRQQRLRFPLLDFTIFRNKAFTSGVIAAALTMFAISGLQLVITQRFQLVNGFSPMESGLLVSVAAMGAIPTALLGGAYLHKIGLRILIVGGLGFSVPAVLLAIWAINQSVCWMIVSLLLIGVGLGASMSVASTAIIGNAPVQRAGMAASVEEVSYEFGGLIAIALLGSLLAAIYTTTIVLPEGSFDAARDSMAAAALLAAHTPTDGVLIFSAAAEAFDRGVYAVMTVIAVVLILAALITGTLLRNYGPGSVSSLYSEHHYEDK